jgi:hypothetical protein
MKANICNKNKERKVRRQVNSYPSSLSLSRKKVGKYFKQHTLSYLTERRLEDWAKSIEAEFSFPCL